MSVPLSHLKDTFSERKIGDGIERFFQTFVPIGWRSSLVVTLTKTAPDVSTNIYPPVVTSCVRVVLEARWWVGCEVGTPRFTFSAYLYAMPFAWPGVVAVI